MHFTNFSTVSLLVALALLAGATVAAVYGAARRRRLLGALLAPPLDQTLTRSVHAGKRRLRTLLFFAAFLCFLVALARPWWGSRLVPMPKRSRDLLFVVDCSRSMLAKDVAPSRLEHAKWWVRELAAKCAGDRFGLIAFAGDAFLECPLTQDANTLYQFLNALDTRTIPVGGTNIASGLQVARKAFRAAEGAHQAIILITDGEELEGKAESEVSYFRENRIPLFVVGIGDPDHGSMIQTEDNALIRDAAGKTVTTRLNETGLKMLAERTDGIYVRSTSLNANVLPVYQRVRQLVPAENADGAQKRPLERYQIPLLLGVLLLFLRFLIGERRTLLPKAALPLLLAMLFVTASQYAVAGTAGAAIPATPAPAQLRAAPPLADPATPGAAALAAPDNSRAQLLAEIAKAEKELRRARPEHAPRLHFNLGCLQQRAGDLAKAQEEYEKAIAAAHAQKLVRAVAYQNLGVTKHHLARQEMGSAPDKAIADLKAVQNLYRESMLLFPANEGVAADQEQLLGDLRQAEAFKQMAEKLKQQLKAAQEKTRDALEQQRAANAASQPEERQQKQAAAQQKTAAAKAATDSLAQQAKGVSSEQMQQRLEQAGDQLTQAQQKQEDMQEGPRTAEAREQLAQEAAQRLDQALQLLGGQAQQAPNPEQQQTANGGKPDQEKQPTPNPAQGQKPEGQAGEPDGQEPAPSPNEKPPENGTAGVEKDVDLSNIDQRQAMVLLQQIQHEEQNFREAVKKQQRNSRLQETARDW